MIGENVENIIDSIKEIKKNFEKYSLFHTIIFEDKIEIIYYLLSNKNI